MMPRMREGEASRPGRRALLLGALATLPLVAGCGIRLEDDAPHVPFVPTREPLPAEDLLTALTRACADLADLAATASGDLPARLVPVHRRQHTVLRTTLLRLGVPVAEIDTVPTPTGAATSSSAPTSPSPSPSAARAELTAEEGAAAAGAARYSGVEADLRATVAALHAQRFAAATLLAGRPPAVPTAPVTGPLVRDLAERTEGAVYLLEVATARSDDGQRDRGERTLEVLRGVLHDQVSGGSRPEPDLGLPLPFAVESPADAARLARTALTALREGYGAQLAELVDGLGDPGWNAATRWLGAVEAECHRWGLSLQPFPGLT